MLAAASAIAILSAAPAWAARIVYTFAGTFSGTASGQTFTDQDVIFNATGDTATARIDASGLTLVDLSSVIASMGGVVVFSLSEPTVFGLSATQCAAGILDRAVARRYFSLVTPNLTSYDGVSSFSEAAATRTLGTGGADFAISSGPSAITGITNLRFSAVVAAANAVPEPASWGLMLAGFGLVGGALRVRRRTATVAVA